MRSATPIKSAKNSTLRKLHRSCKLTGKLKHRTPTGEYRRNAVRVQDIFAACVIGGVSPGYSKHSASWSEKGKLTAIEKWLLSDRANTSAGRMVRFGGSPITDEQKPTCLLPKRNFSPLTWSDEVGSEAGAFPCKVGHELVSRDTKYRSQIRQQAVEPPIHKQGVFSAYCLPGGIGGPKPTSQEQSDRDSCPSRRLIRPISARSIAAARRVTQDYARPFCTVKAATARGFCDNLTANFRNRPSRASMTLSRKKARTKKEMSAYPLDLGPFVQRTTSMKDWPD
jgi:hypothetical protein